MTVRTRLAAALAFVLLVAGCSPATREQELIVYAAPSLDAAFTQLGSDFEAAHPGVAVKLSFDGSATLVGQLVAGAPADVLATADRSSMQRAVTDHLISGTPRVLTTDVLTLIVPAGNPAGITGLDHSLDGKKLATCADAVPCGSATSRLARLVGVTLHPVFEESRVSDVRARVETGQADAGIVYTTDATAAGSTVETIRIAHADEVRDDYLIGVPTSADEPDLAEEFVAYADGAQGREVLAAAGFGG